MADRIDESAFIQARIPTDVGEFQLCLYRGSPDGKEHLAVVMGDVHGRGQILTRIHSECFTGDVLGSRRCDCGEQLQRALQMIATAGAGIVLYLRQEGRGIGLAEKLRAYNLQDQGYDTVDANLMLGHADDEREYDVAADMLRALGVQSVRLLTNNPTKIEGLEKLGIPVTERLPLHPQQVTADNAAYLQTKVERMRHLLQLQEIPYTNGAPAEISPLSMIDRPPAHGRAAVTLSYAQTLDGSIAARRGQPLAISGPESLRLTHQLRAAHDGILVGIETVLADDPSLTVRLVPGESPTPLVLDSHLRLPLTAKLLQNAPYPIVFTTPTADPAKQAALEAKGATVIRVGTNPAGQVALDEVLRWLPRHGFDLVMVEGGAGVIASFLESQLADWLVLTTAPRLVGGLTAVGRPLANIPTLLNSHQVKLGQDWVLWGELCYPKP